MPNGEHPNSLKALEENRHKGQFSGEYAVESAKKAAAAKLQRKSFREQFQAELDAIINQKDKDGNVISTITVKDAITKQMVQKALKGNTRAFELIRDTIGEKPSETIVVTDVDPDVVKQVEMMVNDS